MSTANTPTPTAMTTQKAAAAAEKKTITLTFEGADAALHARIIKDAEEDERTPSINLLRFVRKHYGKIKEAAPTV